MIFATFTLLRLRINLVSDKSKSLSEANEKLREARVKVLAGRQNNFDEELVTVMKAESALDDARMIYKGNKFIS